MTSCLPKRMCYVIFCLSFVVATYATIRNSATRRREVTEENSVVTPRRSRHDHRILSTSHSHTTSNDPYQKSKCIPRSHDYDNTAVTTPAPNIFRVQMVVTTTTNDDDTTKMATFTIQFNRTWSPRGVDRLYQLVLDHYLDCAVFFRVVPGKYR
jgi:hypothetical protein